VSRGRWFLPDEPDVLSLLREQAAITRGAVDALAAWGAGDALGARLVEEAEPRGDRAKRALVEGLHEAFVTPIEPEDLFSLSRSIDWILNWSRDLIEESEAMEMPPDFGLAEMTRLLGEGMAELERAVDLLGEDGVAATAAADRAIKAERRLAHVYYAETARLLDVADQRERIARRELYRRCERIAQMLVDVCERVAYSVVKET
jgi:uncharacterized protein Yka (UPF0111/DUF47 family)